MFSKLAVIMSLCFTGLCFADSDEPKCEESVSWQEQIGRIDQDIEKKNNLRNLYEAKAARAKNQGDRLQFNSENVTEARRYWQIADYYNAQADLLGKEIEALHEHRSDVLNKYNNGKPFSPPPVDD